MWEERAKFYPPGRVVTPQEVAELIAFLATEESSGIASAALEAEGPVAFTLRAQEVTQRSAGNEFARAAIF